MRILNRFQRRPALHAGIGLLLLLAPVALAASDADLLAGLTGQRGGLALIVADDVTLARDLAARGGWRVVLQCRDPEAFHQACAAAEKAGLLGDPLRPLLAADSAPRAAVGSVDLLVVAPGVVIDKRQLSASLVPGTGVAVLLGERSDPGDGFEQLTELPGWLLRAPPANGADDWTHVKYDAGNNPVSQDSALRPPLDLQWHAHDRASWDHTHVAAAGRLFSILPGTGRDAPPELVTRGLGNGVVLWRRSFAAGHALDGSLLVASPDTLWGCGDGASVVTWAPRSKLRGRCRATSARRR